jgi:predicted NBD/HSP70 family sugar kinase
MSAEPTKDAPEPANVTSLRRRNRATVLKQIILARETTRAQIADQSGLSAASAINLVSGLIAEGLVEEKRFVSSRGGRPIAILSPRADSAITIGADVGERGVAVELFDLAMNRIDRQFSGGSERQSPAQIGDDITSALAALRERHTDRWASLLGIGLGLPGLVETDRHGRQMLYAQSLGWPPIPVADLCAVEEPVFAENGAKMQTRAELWYGAARGHDHALVALLGRGVGVGIVSGGKLAHGSSASAGEWGHMIIERNGRRCPCGNRGCVEAYLGSDAILTAWKQRGGVFHGSGWNALGALIDAAASGDTTASDVFDDTIDCLGAALGSLVNLTNPTRIVVGGWVGLRLMEAAGTPIHAAVQRHSLSRPGSQFDIVSAELGGDSVATGCALLPMEALIAAP